MSHATSATRPLAVRIGTTLTVVLGTVAMFAAMTLMHYPGLIKLAGLLAVAFAAICTQEWRDPAATSSAVHFIGPCAVLATVAVAAVWPALPGEQIVTVAIVAGLSIAHSVNLALVRRHAKGGGIAVVRDRRSL